MTRFGQAARKFMKNVMSIMAGVLCLFSLAILLGNKYRLDLADEEFRQALRGGLSLLVVALPFGLSGYGLTANRWWAAHLSLLLTAALLSLAVFDSSVVRSPVGPVFWLMTVALPFAAYLEIHQIRTWVLSRRHQES